MFKIRSLKVGELYLPHGDALMRDPVHCWLVTDGTRHIMVDSGMPDIAFIRQFLKVDGYGGGHESIRKCLAEHGLTPEDITHIVPTHLHYDHGWNLDLFPHAQIVVQRDELFHAIDPTPTQRIFYFRQTIIELINRKRPAGLRLIDGDIELFEGFRLMKLPSHTAGMQIPIITTEKGKAAIVSDLGDHYKYWYPADPRATRKPMRYLSDTFLVGALRSSTEAEWCAAMRTVLDNADIVIPAHDFRIPTMVPEQWFDVPESNDGDIAFDPIPTCD